MSFHKIIAAVAAVACLALSGTNVAYAEIKPIPMPSDARLVEFAFDPNDTFVVLARPRSVTNIALREGEEIVALALGDTFQWQVKDAPGHLFVKPLRPNITTSATLVTNERTYQFTLQSSPEDGAWYQRVSFNYPDMMVREVARRQAKQNMVDAENTRLERQVVSRGVAIEKLNWDYSVDGKASFKPTQVFDDGRFTWVKMPKTQDMPAFFMVNANGDPELINTHLKGDYVVVQRLVDRLLLKLGEDEVTVRRAKGGFSDLMNFFGSK
ncbi:TrbG/VirB9 family P-type conjugative transfer protein [Azonexus hydrophilus]|uniref:TrbG/VirB9 family P-type conjugative transfer protein n=1 Tax=Azonexus hydrophilus TaxID=418702 RepID=A0ABZ2XLK2_9RHOO